MASMLKSDWRTNVGVVTPSKISKLSLVLDIPVQSDLKVGIPLEEI